MNKRYTTPELDELFDRYRLAPDSTVFAPLADACRKAGMVEEALLVCARGIKAHPGYASGHVVHGKCYFDADRPADAEASFRRVLELDDRNLVALKYLGIIRAELGDAPGARRFFEDILTLDPEDREIRRRLQQLGEPVAPSVAAPAQASRVAPTPAPVPEDESVHELRDVADDEFEGEPITLRDASVTSDEIATLTLADIYAAQGHPVKALRIYREVLRRQPNNEELKRKIDGLEGAAPAAASPDIADVETLLPPIPDAPAKATSPSETSDERTSGRRPALPAPPGGNPIDESRSYEQFKRWLRAMS